MNILASIPEKFRVWVEVVVNAVPVLKCSMEGHQPLDSASVAGPVRACARCRLVYLPK